MQLLFFSTSLKGIIRKNANHLQTTDTLKRHQRYSIHYHCGWPSLGIWGSATHNGLTALPEPFLRACGLHRVCTRLKKNQSSRAILWCSGWFYVFNFIDWCNLFFQHYLRALSAKNANHLQTTDTLKRHQRYSIRYHCGWPSLGIWGSDTHNGLTALPEPFLRACGLYRVCTGFVQDTKKSKQQSNSPCCQLHLQRLYVYGAHVLTVPNHLYLTSATDGHVVNSVNSMNLGMMSSSVFV